MKASTKLKFHVVRHMETGKLSVCTRSRNLLLRT